MTGRTWEKKQRPRLIAVSALVTWHHSFQRPDLRFLRWLHVWLGVCLWSSRCSDVRKRLSVTSWISLSTYTVEWSFTFRGGSPGSRVSSSTLWSFPSGSLPACPPCTAPSSRPASHRASRPAVCGLHPSSPASYLTFTITWEGAMDSGWISDTWKGWSLPGDGMRGDVSVSDSRADMSAAWSSTSCRTGCGSKAAKTKVQTVMVSGRFWRKDHIRAWLREEFKRKQRFS